MSAGAAANPLLPLLELARRARSAANADELAFLAVNDTRGLAPYRQAALWLAGSGVHTLSGVVSVEANAPYVQWLERLCRTLAEGQDTGEPVAVDHARLPPQVAAAWDEWLPASATWIPLHALSSPGTAGPLPQGGVLLAGDAPLSAGELALVAEWLDIWQHAWRVAQGRPYPSLRALPAGLRQWWNAPDTSRRWRRRGLAALALVALLCFPVRLTVLAPGELVPAHPATIRAPLDGVIGEFAVQPNQAVASGQALFQFDQAPITSKLEVAREGLATAQAEYRQAAQMMLSDPRAKAQLAALLGKVSEKEAQAAFLEGQAQRSRVVAPQAGVALFDDPQEWIGRPVQTGERIMQIAAPNDVEIEAWLPIGDAIPLPDNAPLELYLAASPLSPLSGSLRYMSTRAVARPDGTYAYRVRARLDGPTDRRIGLKGSAKLSGGRVPLVYWILRRPLATIRQFLAL